MKKPKERNNASYNQWFKKCFFNHIEISQIFDKYEIKYITNNKGFESLEKLAN